MKDGKIVDIGRPDEVLNRENIKRVYGVDAIVYKNPFGIFDIELIQREDPKALHIHCCCRRWERTTSLQDAG